MSFIYHISIKVLVCHPNFLSLPEVFLIFFWFYFRFPVLKNSSLFNYQPKGSYHHCLPVSYVDAVKAEEDIFPVHFDNLYLLWLIVIDIISSVSFFSSFNQIWCIWQCCVCLVKNWFEDLTYTWKTYHFNCVSKILRNYLTNTQVIEKRIWYLLAILNLIQI